MATETKIRIRRNPYRGFEVRIDGNGEVTRRCFTNGHELMTVLSGECVDDRTLEEAADLFEQLEWSEAYPLGVVDVGEAVTDSPVDDEPDRHRELIEELRYSRAEWKRGFLFSFVANAVLAAAFAWCWWRN